MTDLDPPKLKIVVLHNPIFFDDAMATAWTPTHGTLSQDGDSCELTLTSDPGDMFKPTSAVYNSNPHRYLVVLVSEFSGDDDYTLCVAGEDYEFYVSETFTTIGLKIIDLYARNSNVHFNYEAIGALLYTTGGKLKIDFVAIVDDESTLNLLLETELEQKLSIKHPLLNKGVAGAEFSIPNFAGEFNGAINEHDAILIYLARSLADLEKATFKRFGGRVVSISNRTSGYGKHFIDVECHGWAAELLAPPDLLQAIYEATNGRTIIEAALALSDDLVACPPESNWFDNAGSSGSTDDRINSTHSVVFDEKKLITPIQEILENAKNPSGVQGFDMYERPNGSLVGHLRNSLDFVSPIDPLLPESYVYKRDIHPIVNKQRVYGSRTKKEPLDGDSCTEGITNWTSDGTLSADGSDKQVGSYSVKTTVAAIIVYAERSLAVTVTTDFRTGHKKLHAYAKCDNTVGNNSDLIISLCAPNYANSFYHVIPMVNGVWAEIDIPIGRNEKIWGSYGSPDWNNIQNIRFTLNSSGGSATVTLHIDNFFFTGACFSDEDEDPTSQGLYGVRCAEPIVDEALMTDAECLARAESIIKQLKDPIKSLSNVVTDGNEGLWPGQRQHVHGTNDGINETFRIIEVEDRVQGGQWDAILTLDNEPQLIDQAFLLIAARTKRLEHKP